jgi:RNA polymerase sigma-32 factor
VKANHIARNDQTRDMPPPLTASEEATLCHRWHEHHDVGAAERLVGSHLHMVAGIAMAHRGYGVLTQELIGEGYVGLMQAACRYDPSCGTRFASYATCWVRAAIQQSILRAAPAMHADETIDSTPLPHVRRSEQSASVQFT